MEHIKLTVLGTSANLHGFRYFWLKDVVGYDIGVHCARCLRGRYERRVNREMPLNHQIVLRSKLVYLCGVSPRWQNNLHAAAELAPGESFSVPTYNGMTAHFENARRIEIQPLPDGWGDLPKAFTTCRNFQFAVQMSGASAPNTSA